MKKYLKVFRCVILFLSCLLCATYTAKAVTIKNKLGDFRLPPYKANAAIYTHGVSGDVLSPIAYKKESLGYGHFKIHSLYRGSGSLISLGVGYRQFINPSWVGGIHAHIEGGKLPQGLGGYAKLSPGIEAHTARGRVGFNVYFPIQIGSFNSTIDLDKVQTRDYKRHTERVWRYMDQNQMGCDIAGDYNISQYLTWGAGLYGAKQVSNPSIVGVMTRLEYSLNRYVSFQTQYSFDNFRDHTFVLGVQFSTNSLQTEVSSTSALLWRPLDRHIAPIQMLQYDAFEKKTHHLFLDSSAKELGATDASYENPSPKLNDDLLERLRQHYPDETQKVVLHLSGAFDLAEGKKASLALEPNEHIKGEICQEGILCARKMCVKDTICQFDLLKFFDGNSNAFILDESCLSDVPKVIHFSAEAKRTDKCMKMLRTLNMLFENERVIDGRAILRGAVYMNDNTSLSQLAILPAAKATDVSATALDKRSPFEGQISAVIVPKKKDNLFTKKVSIKNIVISGWPGHKEPYQYENGIELSGCISPEIASVWINQAQVGIWFNGVEQSQNGALRDIYMGSPHLTADLNRIEEIKQILSNMARTFKQTHQQDAYDLNQKMLDGLKTRAMIPSRHLKHIKGIRTDNLPSSITFNDLDIESRVLIGMHAQSRPLSASHSNSDKPSPWGKLKSLNPFKTKTNFLREQAPKNLSLHISNSFVMAEMLPVFVSDELNLTFVNPMLVSRYLGCGVKDAHLNLLGRSSQDSFVYVRSSEALPRIEAAAHSIGWLQSTQAKLEKNEKKRPQAFCLEYDKLAPEKTGITLLDMGVIMTVSSDHWLSRIDQSNINEFFTRESEQIQLTYKDKNNVFLSLYPKKVSEIPLPIKPLMSHPEPQRVDVGKGHQKTASEAQAMLANSREVLKRHHQNKSLPYIPFQPLGVQEVITENALDEDQKIAHVALNTMENQSPVSVNDILDCYEEAPANNRTRFSGGKKPVDLLLNREDLYHHEPFKLTNREMQIPTRRGDTSVQSKNNQLLQGPKGVDTNTSILEKPSKMDSKGQAPAIPIFHFQNSNTGKALPHKIAEATVSQPNGNRVRERGLSISTQHESPRGAFGKKRTKHMPVIVGDRVVRPKTPNTPTYSPVGRFHAGKITKASSRTASPQISQKAFSSKAGNGLAGTMTSQGASNFAAGTQRKVLNGVKPNADSQIVHFSEASGKPHRNKSPLVPQEKNKNSVVPTHLKKQESQEQRRPEMPKQINSTRNNVNPAPYGAKIATPPPSNGLGIVPAQFSAANDPQLFGNATAVIAAIGNLKKSRQGMQGLTPEEQRALNEFKKNQRHTMGDAFKQNEDAPPPVPQWPK